MRIVMIGQAAFGEAVLKALLDAGRDVVGVFTPPDKEGRPVDPLTAAAEAADVPVHQFPRLREVDAVEAFKSLKPDLGIMAFVTDIVPMAIINAPTHGTINFHPSLLPEHRGPSSINWPIIQGKKKTGLTIFWPDDGLDTGPILLQKEVGIGPDDTLGVVYFKKIFPLGVEAMVEAVRLVEAGKAPRIEQDESKATYESWCKAEHAVIDWSKPLDEVYNLVRGTDPSPGPNSTIKGETIRLFDPSKVSTAAEGAPGEVIAVDDAGIIVAVDGGAIRFARVQPEGGKKVPAQEWAAQSGVQIGSRLGV